MRTRTKSLRGRSRGSALILVIVTLLVVTVVAVGLAYLTTTEDRISGNDKLQKEGFYAAETGLRAGEALLSGGTMSSTTSVTTLLQATPSAPSGGSPTTLDLHDGGYAAVMLTLSGISYGDQQVPFSAAGTNDKPYYTLYIRNNREDGTNAATTDGDRIINLISVGYINLPNGQRLTKILEEQITAADTGSNSGGGKDSTPGGTNT